MTSTLRVVTTTCSNTEIVCALGRADCLVGVDHHSDFPEDVVRRLPRVGRDLGIDVAKVQALRPDLVLASLTVPGHERVVERLEAAGLHTVVLAPAGLEDVYADVRKIAELVGVPARGDALVTEMRERMPAQQMTSAPGILVEWWPKPVIVPGAQSWVTDLIELAGGHNPFGREFAKSLPVPQDAALADVQAAVISWCGVDTKHYRPSVVRARPAWQAVPAVVQDRIFPIPEAFLGRPGPRLVEGYLALREVVSACVAPDPP